ncbi:Hypothetical_protein [Hexamita inflata]|uniref:Hypothetical_protein n=1 Tax=Hexamita inflata TaxID=28002 RepID=A0AA86TQX0_9EUKA|nr:Hypothetical protein HINF_LOCUS13484 [Hexamita inflata]
MKQLLLRSKGITISSMDTQMMRVKRALMNWSKISSSLHLKNLKYFKQQISINIDVAEYCLQNAAKQIIQHQASLECNSQQLLALVSHAFGSGCFLELPLVFAASEPSYDENDNSQNNCTSNATRDDYKQLALI